MTKAVHHFDIQVTLCYLPDSKVQNLLYFIRVLNICVTVSLMLAMLTVPIIYMRC